jgi:hypothetical protein
VPARNTNTGAQKCVTQRVRNSAGSFTSRGLKAARGEEIAGVVERHQHHYETPQQIDGIEPHRVRSHRRCVRAGGLYPRKLEGETMNVGCPFRQGLVSAASDGTSSIQPIAARTDSAGPQVRT